MKNNTKITGLVITCILVLGIFFLSGCEYEGEESLETLITPESKPIEIAAVSPDTALSGVTLVQLNGTGFSSAPEENLVYFKSTKAEVLQASATELLVRAPIFDVAWDSSSVDATIKVAKQKDEAFSNYYPYRIKAPVKNVRNFSPTTARFRPMSIVVDPAGNILASAYVENNGYSGVYKVTGEGPEFWCPGVGKFAFGDMRYNPSGELYGTVSSNTTALFKLAEGESPERADPRLPKSAGFDFDADGNLWSGGEAGDITRANGANYGETMTFTYDTPITALEVYKGYIYAAVKSEDEGKMQIVRFEIISADEIGAPEVYYDLADRYDETLITSATKEHVTTITFSADDDMYLGTTLVNPDSEPVEPILVVHPDGTSEEWYDGLIDAPVDILDFAWGLTDKLYFTRDWKLSGSDVAIESAVFKIEMQKQGTYNQF